MADEVRVMVGTMAFGSALIKLPCARDSSFAPEECRAVLPGSGRAGRDALPADCFLFWQKKDTGLHAFFIGKIEDPRRKTRLAALPRSRALCAIQECRQRHVCRHFGESPKWSAVAIAMLRRHARLAGN